MRENRSMGVNRLGLAAEEIQKGRRGLRRWWRKFGLGGWWDGAAKGSVEVGKKVK